MLVHEINVLWVPTRPPSLNFCSSSSKAKTKAMQEIWDNTTVDPIQTYQKNQCGHTLWSLLTSWGSCEIFHLVLGVWKVEPFICVSP
jgi:hypothetical protein